MLIKIVIFECTHALFLHILQKKKVLGTIISGDCKLQLLGNLSDTLRYLKMYTERRFCWKI